MIKINYLPYWDYPINGSPEDQSLWFKTIETITEDLIILLKLPLHRFWSQVIFDMELQKSLVRFLSQFPVLIHQCPELLIDNLKIQNFLEAMFKIFLRMGTNREAQFTKVTSYPDLSTQAFASIIYDNYLFDIPKILDLCTIFFPNKKLLSDMLEGIFRKQPKYIADIREFIDTTLMLLDKVCEEFGCIPVQSNGATKLEDKPTPKKMSVEKFLEIIGYIKDAIETVDVFTSTCTSVYQHFTCNHINRLIGFFENYISSVVIIWNSKSKYLTNVKENVVYTIRKTKLIFCTFLGNLLTHSYFDKFDQIAHEIENHQELIENFIIICNTISSTKFLLREFIKYFNYYSKVEQLQNSAIIDSFQAKYILDPVTTLLNITPISLNSSSSEEEVENGVQMLQSIFPNMDSNSLRETLIGYNMDVEHTINAICEELSVLTLDLASNQTKMTNPLSAPIKTELSNERKSIFTGDEFDFYSHDNIDASRIHKGKDEKIYRQDFIDRDHNSEITRSLLDRFEMEYDDEYDDTYDGSEFDIGGGETEGPAGFRVQRLNPKGIHSHRYRSSHPAEEQYEGGPIYEATPTQALESDLIKTPIATENNDRNVIYNNTNDDRPNHPGSWEDQQTKNFYQQQRNNRGASSKVRSGASSYHHTSHSNSSNWKSGQNYRGGSGNTGGRK